MSPGPAGENSPCVASGRKAGVTSPAGARVGGVPHCCTTTVTVSVINRQRVNKLICVRSGQELQS